jgi:hypothetical protein
VFEDETFGVRSLRLDFDEPSTAILRLDLASEGAPRVDLVGLDGVFRPSLGGRPIVARGAWEDPRTFVIEIDEGPGLNGYDFVIRFEGRAIRIEVLGAILEGSMEARPSG